MTDATTTSSPTSDEGSPRRVATLAPSPLASVNSLLDDAPTSRFHHRAVFISGMGFFTDAYDLFVISTVATIVAIQWHLSTSQTSWVTGSAILGAFVGAFAFGRIADVIGRKTVYTVVAAIMIVGAIASALAPSFAWLVAARFVLGLGIGGDYPVSAVLMSEYANRRSRGRLVGLVFSMQAVGLVVGPLAGLVLLSSGVSSSVAWRLLLGLGALPAAAVIYLRAKMPESPRFQASIKGQSAAAVAQLRDFTNGVIAPTSVRETPKVRMNFWQFVRNRQMLMMILGTAGGWFLFDYAYYGNTLSLPSILKEVSPHASLEMKLVLSLIMFVVFALPGYALAVWKMDKIGHRKLQIIGFAVMAACFLVLAAVPRFTTLVVPFIAIFGLSYLFTEFGPNTTTFVLPSEVFPVEMRTTGHGIAAGVGKLGAFAGVFFVPLLQSHFGLRGMLVVAGASALLGLAVTFVLPEPSQTSLEDVAEQRAKSARAPRD